MANNYPDGGEQPLGPVERKVLPWLAWLFTAVLITGAIAAILARWLGMDILTSGVIGFAVGGPVAAWALRPWAS